MMISTDTIKVFHKIQEPLMIKDKKILRKLGIEENFLNFRESNPLKPWNNYHI